MQNHKVIVNLNTRKIYKNKEEEKTNHTRKTKNLNGNEKKLKAKNCATVCQFAAIIIVNIQLQYWSSWKRNSKLLNEIEHTKP